MLGRDPAAVDIWRIPDGLEGQQIACVADWISKGHQALFEEGIRRWTDNVAQLASRLDDTWLDRILYKSIWTRDPSLNPDWLVMAGIKRMDPGLERDSMLARAEHESPLFFVRCMADGNCG